MITPKNKFKDNEGLNVNENDYAREEDLVDLDTQLENVTKRVSPKSIKCFSESILGVSNFQEQLATRFDCEVIDGAYGGSHVGASLAEVSDKVYALVNDENSLYYSNDLTQAEWRNDSVTATRVNLANLGIWNKITKDDDGAYRGVRTDLAKPYSLSAKGFTLMFDLYIPKTEETPIKSLRLFLADIDVYAEEALELTELEEDTFYRIVWTLPDSEVGFTKGSAIRFMLNMNRSDDHAIGTMYVRNFSLSYENVGFINNYVETQDAYSSPISSYSKEIQLNPYKKRYELALLCYGRNEANASISKEMHELAYEKLFANVMRETGQAILMSPPPKYDTTEEVWADDDKYISEDYIDIYDRLTQKINSVVDVNTRFRSLDGSDIMLDSWHQNETGSALIIDYVAEEVNTRKIPIVNPILKNDVIYRMDGIQNGTWETVRTQSTGKPNPEVVVASDAYSGCLVSSTQNDYIEWADIEFRQLHLLARKDTNYGTIDIIIDEGTDNEVTYEYDGALDTTDNMMAQCIVDFGETDSHSVKLKVSSSGLNVKIHGIVTI